GRVLCRGSGRYRGRLVVRCDIVPEYAGTAAGLMNTGSAFAAITSPLAAGYIIDVTGNWELPFFVLMGLLITGALTAFAMHPEIPFEEPEPQSA
ncbi:MAG: MFS transporter, partial [Proteobacteria bacterium]|nr:MFS transporter [Pseudomonadota bacterium]